MWFGKNPGLDARFTNDMKALFRRYGADVQAAQRSELLDALTDRLSPEIIDQVTEAYDDAAPRALDRVTDHGF